MAFFFSLFFFLFFFSVSILFVPLLADLTDDQVTAVKQLLAESAHERYLPPLLPPEFSLSQLILQLGARHKSTGTVGTRQSRVLSHDVWSETSAQ